MTVRRSSFRLLALVLTFGVAALPTPVFASGFQLVEQNASGLGNAFAGQAAGVKNASAIYFNPAALTRVKGWNLVASVEPIGVGSGQKLVTSGVYSVIRHPAYLAICLLGSLPGLAGRIGVGPGPPNERGRIDKDRTANNAGGLFAVHLLDPPGPVALQHHAFRITQELDRKVVLSFEFLVRRDRIGAYPQHDRAQSRKVARSL